MTIQSHLTSLEIADLRSVFRSRNLSGQFVNRGFLWWYLSLGGSLIETVDLLQDVQEPSRSAIDLNRPLKRSSEKDSRFGISTVFDPYAYGARCSGTTIISRWRHNATA